jgi:ATP-dependent Lhr-like helicase
LCVASHAFELVEFAAARRAQSAARLEARRPLKRSLDVLVQHLGTLAAGPGFRTDELLKEVRSTHAFAALSDAEWRWALDFLTNGGQALHNYEAYRRVTIEDGVCRARDARLARLHRLGIGTITSDAEMVVKWLNGARLGTVEEALISRLRPGQAFMFAGRVLELVRVRDMTAYVRLARARSGRVARWQGGRMPLSSELAEAVQTLLAEAAEGPPKEAEMQCVQPLLRLQQRWSRLPTPDTLLVEQAESREGWRLYVFAFAGRTVNEGLAALMAHRWSQREPVTFAVAANDYGAELLSSKPLTVDADAVRALLSPERLAQDLLASLNVSEIARRQFRDIARVAGLVFQGYPGRRKVDRQLQASSGLMYDVLSKYDPGNLLLDQARREVFEMQLEETRLAQTLRSIAERPIHLVRTSSLTPLAFPLWAERLRAQIISTEDWRERIGRMIERLERRAARERA